MMHGPFDNWHDAFAKCVVKDKLLIVAHHWVGGKLYVEAVPEKETA